jgi:hypothetical protein
MNLASSLALAGMESASGQLDRAAAKIRRAAPAAMDTASLSDAAVQLLSARTAFAAAVKLAQTADELDQSSLNLLA